MLGYFILPFFIISLALGLLGLILFMYLSLRRVFYTYFLTNYSMQAQTSLIVMEEIYLTPTVLNYYGIALFLLGLVFTVFAMSVIKLQKADKPNLFNLLFYMIVYLTVYPATLISAIYKMARGKIDWGTK